MEKKYINYNEIDFAEEPSFIRWVQGKDQKATAFWKKWVAKHPEKAADIQAAKVLVAAIKIKETEPSADQIKNLWEKIDAATPEQQPEAIVRPIGRRKWLSFAAAACIGLLAFFFFYNPTTEVNTAFGEQNLAYTLPDNSTVDLNADSKISYQERSFTGERVVHLDGEAFFTVTKGASFKVVTPNGIIEVLGTRFNVNTRNGNLVVDCEEGKVRVSTQADQQILTAGLGTRLNPNKMGLEKAYESDVNRKIGWKTGDFYLKNVSLKQVLEEIERQFAVRITVDTSLQTRVGDYTFKSQSLEQALNNVLFQVNGKFEINGKNVMVSAK